MLGKTLGHYTITSLIGKGGMGEVYRATDAQLGRDVAIKVLPPEVSGDPERAARFEREARTLASLQHPNVASIYGFEEIDGARILIMELVEGRDLSSRLEAGALSIEETTRIAHQIATGLEAAHERGIVHRDLKPANIIVNDAGEAKILDFGLARAWYGDASDETAFENSPTITAAMTQAGTILGTAAYMSPEQARGHNVDRRADIWAFGTILWEMVTGQRLFEGETISDTLAAVLRKEPDWTQLPVDEAPHLCRLIERCLVRDPQQRLRDVGEARILLQDGGTTSSFLAMSATTAARDQAATSGSSGKGGWYAALGMAAVGIVLAALLLTRESGVPFSQTTLGLFDEDAINFASGHAWASLQFSPDGESMAYIGGRPSNLYLRRIDSFESVKLPDTEGARLPAFSPDGRWIAYFTDTKLWKIAVTGGAPVEICDTWSGPGLDWGNGELFFARAAGGGLWAVSEDGGEIRSISTLNEARDETSHRWPQVLPDGRHLLITIKTARIDSFDDASIGLLSLDTGQVTVLMQGGTYPRYVSTGYLLYGRQSQVFAVPFDLQSLSIQGTPTAVIEGVQTSDIQGSSHYALSRDGHLAYAPAMANFWDFELLWIDHSGQISPVEIEQRRSLELAVSPDGNLIAAAVPAANDKIWVHDLEQKTSSRLTNTPGNDRNPVWSPDGTRIAYHNDRSGSLDIYLIAADGGGDAQAILTSPLDHVPTSWSPDGTRLLLTQWNSDGDLGLYTLDMVGDGKLAPFLETPHTEGEAQFSPDGAWVAYTSDSSGELDVYVRPYPGPGAAVRISRAGGRAPTWARDGSTLFYSSSEHMMAVPINRSAGFRAGAPRHLFALEEGTAGALNRIVGSADDDRFIAFRSNLQAKQYQIRVMFDWAKRLKENF